MTNEVEKMKERLCVLANFPGHPGGQNADKSSAADSPSDWRAGWIAAVAEMHRRVFGSNASEIASNARLIAAAPIMYAALKTLVHRDIVCNGDTMELKFENHGEVFAAFSAAADALRLASVGEGVAK